MIYSFLSNIPETLIIVFVILVVVTIFSGLYFGMNKLLHPHNMLDVITHPGSNFKGGFVKPLLKLAHGVL